MPTQPSMFGNDAAEPQRRDTQRVAIIGAGPLGLEAAHYAAACGFSVRVFEESNQVAPRVRSWEHLGALFSWDLIRTELGTQKVSELGSALGARQPRGAVYPSGEELLRLYLEPLAAALPSKTLYQNTRVVGITRAYLLPTEFAELPIVRRKHPFRIITRNNATTEERAWSAEYVLDCTSGGSVPAWLGCGGLPAIGEMGCSHLIARSTPDILGKDRMRYLNKKTLLVGDGQTAASSAALLAELAESNESTQFLWAVRSDRELPCELDETSPPTSRRNMLLTRANLIVKSAPKFMVYSKRTQVEEIRYNYELGKFFVTLQIDRQTKRYQFDNAISNVGNRREDVYMKQLAPEEPGFFEIGGLQAEDNDQYFRAGHAQILNAFQTICQDSTLNLYGPVERAA